MKSDLDFLIDEAKEEEKYFKDYLGYSKRIKDQAKKLLGEVKVFVFGSVLKKDEVPRDIDILIVSPKLKRTTQKSKIRSKIWKKIGFFPPFELHLITPQEYKNWYQHFLGKKIEV